MRQVIQYQKTGALFVDELPAPALKPGSVLVRSACSLISAGTERSSVQTARASLIAKARSRPDLVRQVMDNFKREGLRATYEKVLNRLDHYKELGYSSSGIVLDSATDEFRVGDRVACAGVGFAVHADIASVPRNLVVNVPEKVGLDEAAFATVGAIALQGVRQADVRIGECTVVIGLGLIGLITVQLLRAAGCDVYGIDVSDRNFDLARRFDCRECSLSASDVVSKIVKCTGGRGADAVLITAATNSNEPMEMAMQIARKKGVIVVVGAVGMDLPRSPFYEKELDVRISCSYGPGRYDPVYEEESKDYPFAYVRWTENRNMSAVVNLIAEGRLDVKSLISHSFDISDAVQAYELITGTTERLIGVLLRYPEQEIQTKRVLELEAPAPLSPANPVVGVIGAGNHAQSYLLPALRRSGVRLKIVANRTPVNAKAAGKKFGFEACATDIEAVLSDAVVNLLMISTRHDSHASLVVDALRRGKNVFVEKPLAINREELEEIELTYRELAEQKYAPLLMVGYNRRFSSPVRRIKEHFGGRTSPLLMTYRVNAGQLAPTSWYQNPKQGGRVIGEVGHFVDTMQYLCDSAPRTVFASAVPRSEDQDVVVLLTFHDGSLGTVIYSTSGAIAVGKEYLEVSAEGKMAQLFDFRKLTLATGRKQKRYSFSGKKGHEEEICALIGCVREGERSPIAFESLTATSRATFAVLTSLKDGGVVEVA